MMHSFNHSFIQQILTEMGKARDKGPEELNRDTDRHRSGRKPRKPGRQVCRGRDLTHLPVPSDGCSDWRGATEGAQEGTARGPGGTLVTMDRSNQICLKPYLHNYATVFEKLTG